MTNSKTTLKQLISELQERLQVPRHYVDAIVELLQGKGISLDSDAAPYAEALTRSFQFRSELHKTTTSLRNELNGLKGGLDKLQERCRRIAQQAYEVEQRLQRGRRVQSRAATDSDDEPTVTAWGPAATLLPN